MPGASLAGKVAVVTGAGTGIGAAVVSALAREAASIALIGRTKARLDETASALSVDTLVATADVTDPESVEKAFEAIRQRFPRIDILVNNAGQAESAPFTRTDLALWNRMLAVNLTGTYLCTHAVLAAMLKQDYGRIVNVASSAGLVGIAYASAYTAAKHGVVGLTRALALEAAKTPVTVNAVCPGYVETAIVRNTIANIVAKTGKSAAEALAAITSHNPQGRLIRPDEVASTVLWLCLPGSESVNGQAIAMTGGGVI